MSQLNYFVYYSCLVQFFQVFYGLQKNPFYVTGEVIFIISYNVIDTPIKRLNAQHLVEYLKKQLLYEENLKSGNVMQQPMDSCVRGKNTSSESILIRFCLLSAR